MTDDPMPYTWSPEYPAWKQRQAEARTAKLAATPVPDDLVPVALVPVEVFGGDCDCHEAAGHSDAPTEGVPDGMTALRGPDGTVTAVVERCPGWSYGLSDAVEAWSDCNRAEGRIYRIDDTNPDYRQPGDTVRVYVSRADLPWFEKRFGEQQHEDGADDERR